MKMEHRRDLYCSVFVKIIAVSVSRSTYHYIQQSVLLLYRLNHYFCLLELAEFVITGILAWAIVIVASVGTTETCDTLTDASDKRYSY